LREWSHRDFFPTDTLSFWSSLDEYINTLQKQRHRRAHLPYAFAIVIACSKRNPLEPSVRPNYLLWLSALPFLALTVRSPDLFHAGGPYCCAKYCFLTL